MGKDFHLRGVASEAMDADAKFVLPGVANFLCREKIKLTNLAAKKIYFGSHLKTCRCSKGIPSGKTLPTITAGHAACRAREGKQLQRKKYLLILERSDNYNYRC